MPSPFRGASQRNPRRSLAIHSVSRKVVASNRRARRNYDIGDTFEAGLVLRGSEVKSIRDGNVDLKDSFGFVRNGEAWLVGAHIAPYPFARDGGHQPERERKLLLHARELDRITGQVQAKGLTLVPMSLYFIDGKVKIELGLGKGKRSYDKRDELRKKDQRRDIDRALRGR
ncbi:MAG: SsrA-binding protein SmpB [Acidimicrobiia bacterium]|nr:SsrA-binding protein SmpB [Acidimicrobiia bacterium]